MDFTKVLRLIFSPFGFMAIGILACFLADPIIIGIAITAIGVIWFIIKFVSKRIDRKNEQ